MTMKNDKHTPGPWFIGKPAPDMNTRCAIRDTDGWEIAEIPGLPIDQPHERQDANAALIARAPLLIECREVLNDLFQQCAMIHKSWGDGDNSKQADAAISKARALLAKIDEE